MVALVGRSGSGKSTLAALIPRFYQHGQGQILLDGVDVQDYTLLNLRQHIAQVTQQVTLFSDTVARNIAYGDLADALARTSRPPPRLHSPRASSISCRKVSTRLWAKTVCCSPAASASAWPSPVHCSRTPPC
ncbi:ATP-binding cassette domain-containing protein [Pseudomonas sp. KNUC1026]|uniref:ATP-binding cassette domain-containing protein n=1 Tax=Pseudomonas sp. KNUC1026 TaxID=2893890 RepID=UPI0022A75DB5|nr:ATP-binding cassette domain-containing protein [Pseudomonas sp. KNUC1026]